MITTGWWFQPVWNILVSWDHYSQYMEKCSKSPTRQCELKAGHMWQPFPASLPSLPLQNPEKGRHTVPEKYDMCPCQKMRFMASGHPSYSGNPKNGYRIPIIMDWWPIPMWKPPMSWHTWQWPGSTNITKQELQIWKANFPPNGWFLKWWYCTPKSSKIPFWMILVLKPMGDPPFSETIIYVF